MKGRLRLVVLPILAAVLIGVSVWLIVARGDIRGGFRDTAPLAEWFVALGTTLLAIATFLLARQARAEAKAVREQLVASQRPMVAPVSGHDPGHLTSPGRVEAAPSHLVLTNMGAGPALNVRGAVYWTGTAGGAASLQHLALAIGGTEIARVLGEGAVVNWSNAVGFLRYHDLSGAEWQTHFRFRADGAGNQSVEVLAAGPTTEFGEPGYNAEVGWVNRPGHVSLWNDDG